MAPKINLTCNCINNHDMSMPDIKLNMPLQKSNKVISFYRKEQKHNNKSSLF